MAALDWWTVGEWADVIGDTQIPASQEKRGSDLGKAAQKTQSMEDAPLGEPPLDYNVRSVYDSRPVNGIDFNMSAIGALGGTAKSFSVSFTVPPGYRAIPRRYEIFFDATSSGGGNTDDSFVNLQQGGADLNYNGPVLIGTGGTVECFYVCEENTTFGLRGAADAFANNAYVNVYGNLIPVTDVSLPFAIANPARK